MSELNPNPRTRSGSPGVRLTPEEARELHRDGTTPSQDTPGLGGVPLEFTSYPEAEGIRGKWLTDEAVREAVEREAVEDLIVADPAGLELPEGRVLRVVPGDVVMFQFPDDATLDLEQINRAIEGILPDGVTALILSDGVEVTRITTEFVDGYRAGYGDADNGYEPVIPEEVEAVIPAHTADAIASDGPRFR